MFTFSKYKREKNGQRIADVFLLLYRHAYDDVVACRTRENVSALFLFIYRSSRHDENALQRDHTLLTPTKHTSIDLKT